MPEQTRTPVFIDGLYGKLVEGGINYFFPRATLCGGHVCMILTPNGEMKIFAEGVQVFHFLDGRWRLTDAQRKYDLWKDAVRNIQLAERLFTTALNLAEDRRGGLLVVLDDPAMAASLVSRTDLLTSLPSHGQHAVAGAK